MSVKPFKDLLIQQEEQLRLKSQELAHCRSEIESLKAQVHAHFLRAESLRLKSRLKRRVKKILPKGMWAILKYLKCQSSDIRRVVRDIANLNFRDFLQTFRQTRCNDPITTATNGLPPPNLTNNCPALADLCEVMGLLGDEISVPKLNSELPIDIIVPIYNGKDFLIKLLASIVNNTTIPFRLLLVNDASTDETIFPFLADFKKQHDQIDMLILDNQKNLGFVASVNSAVRQTRNHFVIVNTDVEVPVHWLERLMSPIFKMEKVASTTPFTNSGTICSFPNWLCDNAIFENMSVNELDHYFKYVDPKGNYVDMPTGVGFCMGVNRDLVEKIGFFDEPRFGRGYGEENDWCRRAVKEGYRNLLVPNLFVYHKHGVSFGDDTKKSLQEQNMKVLTSLHPSYLSDVSNFVSRNPSRLLREMLVMFAASSFEPANRPSLLISHDLGGGAEQFTESLFSDGLSKKVFVLRYSVREKSYIVSFSYKDFSFKYRLDDFSSIRQIVKRFAIKKILVNQLVSYPSVLNHVEIINEIKARNPDVEIELYLHDYFSICPSFNLLNHEVKYCGIPADLEVCRKCLKFNPFIKVGCKSFNSFSPNLEMEVWRGTWFKLLEQSAITCFSNSSRDILLKAYPLLRNIEMRSHEVNWVKQDETIRIGVVGHLAVHKGLNVVRKMLSLIANNSLGIEIIVLGHVIDEFASLNFTATVLGEYKNRDLRELLSDYRIDIALVPSICPETFSYTTEEIIKMGFPLAVFDIGAPAERVKNYANGIVIKDIDAKFALEEIASFLGRTICIGETVNENIQLCCVVNNFLIYDSTVLSNAFMPRYAIHMFDNTIENIRITRRYNQFIENEMGDNRWVIFCHQDFAFLEEISEKLSGLDTAFIYGPIGAVVENGERKIYGEIWQGHEGSLIRHGQRVSADVVVSTIDCACIIAHSSLIKTYDLRFDEELDFHHYAEEFCLNALYSYGIQTKVVQLECVHTSYGNLSDGFFKAVNYVQQKYDDCKYVSTCPL